MVCDAAEKECEEVKKKGEMIGVRLVFSVHYEFFESMYIIGLESYYC